MMSWLGRLVRRPPIDKELDAELRFHLEERTADHIAAGMSPEEARRRTQIELGGIEQVKQQCRDVRWENYVESLFRDFQFALRSLRKDRRSVALAVVALALGIGSATVIFSVFYNLLLNPFPYRNSDRIITFAIQNLTGNGASTGRFWFSTQEFLAFREQNHVFEDMVGHDGGRGGNRVNNGRATLELQGGSAVTANTFEFYAVPPLLGRWLTPEDGKPGSPPVFVMSYRMWQAEFGGDPNVRGKAFVVNGDLRTLVGIMPRRFNIYGSDIWMPMNPSINKTIIPIGRLMPGISLQAATADLDVIAHRLTKAEPGNVLNPERYAVVGQTLIDQVLGNFKMALHALMGAVFMLLLIACTNVANLLLARATVREKEMAVRAALGASRKRLVQQVLVESFVFSSVACIAGWIFAHFGLKGIVAIIPSGTLSGEASIELNREVLWFALGITLLTTFLCGIAPAIHAVKGELQPRLTGSNKGANRIFRHVRLLEALVVTQVALSMVLLVGAGLMIRNFFVLTHAELPFNPAKVLYVRLDLPQDRYYGKPDKKPAFFNQVLPRIAALPGVISATESWMVPPNEGMWTDVAIPGKPHVERWTTDIELCTEGYFRTLGLQLLRGRLLSQDDIDSARRVAVVNETLARQYFGGEDPIGQKIKFEVFDRPFLDAPHNTYFEIIGVIKDFKTRPEQKQYILRPDAFLPLSVVNLKYPPSILVRTAEDPHMLLKGVQNEVWAVDPDIGCNRSGSIEDFLTTEFQQPRFELAMLTAFAGIGLVLVVIGIISLIGYTVELQTHEIGIRIALGAQAGDILRMVLQKWLAVLAVGILVGLLFSLGLTRFMASLLWGVTSTDPWTFGAVIAVLVGVGSAACLWPALHATSVDPLITLRYE